MWLVGIGIEMMDSEMIGGDGMVGGEMGSNGAGGSRVDGNDGGMKSL